jgi:peptidoglycan hydrolase-like protein with peptidoglycan-binding domain
MAPFIPPRSGARSARRRPVAAFVAAALIVGLPTLAGTPALAEESTTNESASAVPAVVPAAPVAYKLGERTLRRGDEGPDVKELQKLLGVKRTEKFNKKTKQAVKRAEKAAGIKPNGIVSKKTLTAIKKHMREVARAKKESSRSLPRAGAPAASQRYAQAYIAQRYGWNSGQMSCLVTLWNRESGWRYWVSNPNGIYRGIPQTSSRVWGALGYTTSQYMSSPEIQIKVGTHYIKGRYGTPCSALSFWNSRHWY